MMARKQSKNSERNTLEDQEISDIAEKGIQEPQDVAAKKKPVESDGSETVKETEDDEGRGRADEAQQNGTDGIGSIAIEEGLQDIDLPPVLSKKEQRAKAKAAKPKSLKAANTYVTPEKHLDALPKGLCEADPLEILIVGAGPHSLSLVLRLLEPCPDMLYDEERFLEGLHTRAGVWTASKMHVQSLRKGPLLQASVSKERTAINDINSGANSTYQSFEQTPAMPLKTFQATCAVVDAHGQWLKEWDLNFSALEVYNKPAIFLKDTCPSTLSVCQPAGLSCWLLSARVVLCSTCGKFVLCSTCPIFGVSTQYLARLQNRGSKLNGIDVPSDLLRTRFWSHVL
jgi:hypothetical protein